MMFLDKMRTDLDPATQETIINSQRRKIEKLKLKIKLQKRYIKILHSRLSEVKEEKDSYE